MCELQAALLNEVGSRPPVICDAITCYDHCVMAVFVRQDTDNAIPAGDEPKCAGVYPVHAHL
jgi:hypothetical protein